MFHNQVPLVCCTPSVCLEHLSCACVPNCPIDTGCTGCGLPGCLVGTLCGFPLGVGYFVDLFKNRVENYIKRLVGKRKPKKVLACMLYYPDQVGRGGWADCALSALGYNLAPAKLETLIRTVFRLATSQIRIAGTEVVGVPLFKAMDGKDTSDYCERVEPSPSGGAKMAELLIETIIKNNSTLDSTETRELSKDQLIQPPTTRDLATSSMSYQSDKSD